MSDFHVGTQIYSGQTALDQLDTIMNQRIMLVCDPFLNGSDELKKITAHFNTNNTTEIFADVKPNPPLTNIQSGVAQFNQFQPTVIVAVGGGSAIDTAKAIRFFGEKVSEHKINCFIAIPTTSGTGSEVTNTAVVSDEKNNVKFPIIEDYLIPDIALLYPELVMSAPQSVSAFSGLDVLTHALEALVAKDANLFTDALAEKVISVICHDLTKVYQQPTNYELRDEVHQASNAAGIAFNQAGLGITHAIAHQLGAVFHVPHGLACAMVLPYVVEYNAQDPKSRAKYATAARKAGLINGSTSDQVAVKKIVYQIKAMMRAMNCPQSLVKFGIKSADANQAIDRIVSAAKTDGTFPGNPIVPTDQDLTAIYKKVIG
ncbi:1-propanol dehydrogenase PduQ [Latilactobacillus fuchuensis]|uniref:1-propanol dehydrogenase PduQ n=1 Tax=Latilactobacillus fuchuensis TaxID=164393 RepID=UPI000469AE8F|nr:1-propanol dehydrogenase PduQ [Latilactobacillus fuchuensis]MCP8857428.1 iron-containing alcohol dehydrogenase [Latilactobacillus fuchuensis]